MKYLIEAVIGQKDQPAYHERKFMGYRLHPVDYVRLGDGLVVEERCWDR